MNDLMDYGDYDEQFDSEDSYDNFGDACSDQTDECQDFADTFESLESSGVDSIEGTASADKLIYPKARISIAVNMILIITFVMKHKLIVPGR